MMDNCLGAQRSRKIQRAFRHCKVTTFCLLLTVVVLRGTIGAGKFGTPGQNLAGIRDHLHLYSRKRAEPHRFLEEVRTTSSNDQAGVDTNSEMAGFWAKLPLIRKLLLSHPEIDFLWWMDSDAMFTDMTFEVPWERNGQWALDILDTWAPMGPKGKVKEEAGKVLTREKWGDKVYLENAYYLHGYWGILVDRYEEMIENYHPGLGDHRWPLVTHFVGCKPCGKFGDYSVERCLKQMDRAFNFGDNQIIQIYGFTHKSLASRRVKRVRNETSNPLEVKDELGLLHPAFKAVKVSSS
ncbi:Xyloglucan 6-xylosyltransferase 1 [Hibiscus syriacus]|uniref:Xyloglucan 6-xylosyltransferase 1 n=1 Tax=Hibiscus syriacus TaxID=106335 RepID=A0A6A2WN19_HIBSY|nr:Xyloglucan 6-xylosyltransferase 1 [Hibiscus syriacus]